MATSTPIIHHHALHYMHYIISHRRQFEQRNRSKKKQKTFIPCAIIFTCNFKDHFCCIIVLKFPICDNDMTELKLFGAINAKLQC